MNLIKKLFGRKKPEPATAAAVSAIRARVYSGEPVPFDPMTATVERKIEGNTFVVDPSCGIVIENVPVLTGES